MGEPVDGVDYVLSKLVAAFSELLEGANGLMHAEAFVRGAGFFIVTNKGIQVAYVDGAMGEILEEDIRNDR